MDEYVRAMLHKNNYQHTRRCLRDKNSCFFLEGIRDSLVPKVKLKTKSLLQGDNNTKCFQLIANDKHGKIHIF